jgi:hypothetical protein
MGPEQHDSLRNPSMKSGGPRRPRTTENPLSVRRLVGVALVARRKVFHCVSAEMRHRWLQPPLFSGPNMVCAASGNFAPQGSGYPGFRHTCVVLFRSSPFFRRHSPQHDAGAWAKGKEKEGHATTMVADRSCACHNYVFVDPSEDLPR